MINKQNKKPWFHPDVPTSVRNHLLGENHSRRHKFIFGFLIALLGASFSHYCSHSGTDIIALLGDHVGFGVHGIGYIPMYKAIEGGKL